MPCFEAHQPAPPSSSPPVSESLFVTCHVSKLTNLLLSLPPSSSSFALALVGNCNKYLFARVGSYILDIHYGWETLVIGMPCKLDALKCAYCLVDMILLNLMSF